VYRQMNRLSRVILVLYCLCLAYCTIWIPWRNPPGGHEPYIRLGYGFLWVGPKDSSSFYDWFATPDIPVIVLRVFALTAIAAAALIATRTSKNKVRDG
jgi:hypothetical protein